MTFLHNCMPAIPKSGRKPDPERAAARAAGWRDCDLDWERLQECALDALRQRNLSLAVRNWRRAWILAFLQFRRDDPRFATSTANLGLVARLSGRERVARRRFAAALRQWGAVPDFIGSMVIARRGRSSLFHLQMEAVHWSAYDQRLRTLAMQLAADTALRLDLASHGQPTPGQRCNRWPGEKPATFDDLRKFLGAALLVASDAPSPEQIRH